MRFRSQLAAGMAAILLAFAAQAQDLGGAEQAGNAALAQRVRELEERLKKLEEKFEKPMTVKAPFVVTDGSGQQVLRVGISGGRSITLGPDSAPAFRVAEAGSKTRLTVTSGSGNAGVEAHRDGTSIVSASNGKNYARLYSANGVAASEVSQGGERGQLSIIDGSSRLKLWQANKPYFLATSSNADSMLRVGTDESVSFDVRVAPSASIIQLTNAKTIFAARADADASRIHMVSGQSNVASMYAGTRSASIGVRSSLDGEGVRLDLDGQKPSLLMFGGGRPIAELSAPEGKSTGLRFYDAQGDLALQAGLGTFGKPSLIMLEKNQIMAGLILNKAGEGLLEIYRPGEKIAAQLGRDEAAKGMGLRVFDDSGKLVLGAGIDNKDVPSVRVIHEGKIAAQMVADEKGQGSVEVMKDGDAAASLWVEDGGSGALQLNSAAGEPAALLGSEGGEGSLDLLRAGTKLSTSLGVKSGRKTALRFYSDAKELAAIGIDDAGSGAMRINGKTGGMLATLNADSDGGGAIIAYDSKGVPAAALATDSNGEGVIQIYGGGHVLGSLANGENGGMLQLNNNAGAVMVEAGNIGTVGIVRAGPIVRASGMPGLPGSFLMGRTQ